MFFVWDDWNIAQIGKHDVEPFEADQAVRAARRPYPRATSGEKMLVRGRTRGGRRIQVIYVLRPADTIDAGLLLPDERLALEAGEPAVYVIHARDLRRGES